MTVIFTDIVVGSHWNILKKAVTDMIFHVVSEDHSGCSVREEKVQS